MTRVLVAVSVLVWIVTAINPHDREDRLLENLLVFAFAGVLWVTHRRFTFSTASYVLYISPSACCSPTR